MQIMRSTTLSRHKTVRECFKKHMSNTNSIDEAMKLTAEETGYSISYIHQIRFKAKLKENKND